MDRAYEYQECIIDQALEIRTLKRAIRALDDENYELRKKVNDLISKYEKKKEAAGNDDLCGMPDSII